MRVGWEGGGKAPRVEEEQGSGGKFSCMHFPPPYVDLSEVKTPSNSNTTSWIFSLMLVNKWNLF